MAFELGNLLGVPMKASQVKHVISPTPGVVQRIRTISVPERDPSLVSQSMESTF